MGTIYRCLTKDERYIPPRYTLVHEAETEEKAIEYLETHGGGIYRNLVHNFDMRVEPIVKEEGE